jgi:hypothetical protein
MKIANKKLFHCVSFLFSLDSLLDKHLIEATYNAMELTKLRRDKFMIMIAKHKLKTSAKLQVPIVLFGK